MSLSRPRDGIVPTPDHLRGTVPEQEGQDLTGVLVKLGVFTVAMVVLPISSYYVSRDYYFKENTTGAGIVAAIMANVLLVSFIWYAIREDSDETRAVEERKMK